MYIKLDERNLVTVVQSWEDTETLTIELGDVAEYNEETGVYYVTSIPTSNLTMYSFDKVNCEFTLDLKKQERQNLEMELSLIRQWYIDNDYKVANNTRSNSLGKTDGWQDGGAEWIDYNKEYDIKNARDKEIQDLLAE